VFKEFDAKKGGPAKYDPLHKLTEKRADIGVVKIQKAPENTKDEVDDRIDLYPNAIKPNKLVFKYTVPIDHKPKHVPDSVLNPETWKYYDVNLDAVREELAKDVNFGAKNENRDDFLERENF
jgi:hypothetical protein